MGWVIEETCIRTWCIRDCISGDSTFVIQGCFGMLVVGHPLRGAQPLQILGWVGWLDL